MKQNKLVCDTIANERLRITILPKIFLSLRQARRREHLSTLTGIAPAYITHLHIGQESGRPTYAHQDEHTTSHPSRIVKSVARLTDAALEVSHRSLVLADREHNEDVPDRMRAAADAVEHVRVRPARREVALGEMRRVEYEPGDVREERRHDGADEREHRAGGVHVGERGERRDAREGEREEEGDAVVL